MRDTSSKVAMINIMTDANDVYDAILEMRRGNGAVVLLTYRGDW